MSNYSFAVRWSDEDAAYVATCPEFPGVSAFGDTAEDAVREGQVALSLVVEDMVEDGEALPAPWTVSGYSGQFRLRVPAYLHRQLAERAELEGVSLNTLAVSYLAAGLGAPGPAPRPAGRRLESAPEESAPKRRSKAA